MASKRVLSVRVPAELLETLERVRDEIGKDIPSMVAEALTLYLGLEAP